MTAVTKNLVVLLSLMVSLALAKTDTEPKTARPTSLGAPVMVETGPAAGLEDVRRSGCNWSAFAASTARKTGLVAALGLGWWAGKGIEEGFNEHLANLQKEREKLYLFQDDVEQVDFDFSHMGKPKSLTLFKRRKFERLVEQLPAALPRNEDRGGILLSVLGVYFERGEDRDNLKVTIKTSMGDLVSKKHVSRLAFEEGRTLSTDFQLQGDSSKWESTVADERPSNWALDGRASFKYDMENKTIRMEGFSVVLSWNHPELGEFNSPRASLFRLAGTLQ